MMTSRFLSAALVILSLVGLGLHTLGQEERARRRPISPPPETPLVAPSPISLPSSKILMTPLPGEPQRTNSFPTAAALSPDGRYLAILNNGYGTEESGYRQSIAILDLNSNQVSDYPDARLAKSSRQTYFLGLAFSTNGKKIYASMASLTDPTGKEPGDTGNGIAVYSFEDGRIAPQSFLKIPLRPLSADKHPAKAFKNVPKGTAVPFPAGLAVVAGDRGEKLLVAENLSDSAVLLDATSGEIVRRFDLSDAPDVPAAYPYGVVVTRDGKTGFCSLWNASQVAQLDLETGRVARRISLLSPESPTAAGSHPTAMLLSPGEKYVYVTLTNSDRVAVVDTQTGVVDMLSTELPGQLARGTFPDALAQTVDGKRLFVANASTNSVAVFDTMAFRPTRPNSRAGMIEKPTGFIPTEWYPTALAVRGDDLLIVTGKGQGTGPNSRSLAAPAPGSEGKHPYIATLIHGSVARVDIREAESQLAKLTEEVEESNLMQAKSDEIPFRQGRNPIRHVIYIIKENRTYDQILGDLRLGDGDPSLCMYCEDVTPNEHKLARQFGILDNFYVSGEVSGDGHVWSMAAITSDYNEKTWEIAYRGSERTYDYEGEVLNGFPLAQGIPDIDEPGTGYI